MTYKGYIIEARPHTVYVLYINGRILMAACCECTKPACTFCGSTDTLTEKQKAHKKILWRAGLVLFAFVAAVIWGHFAHQPA